MKYLLKILSLLFSSLGLFAVVAAQSEGISLEVMNLPLLQEPNKTFTFDLSVSSQFEGNQQKATLVVDDCGSTLAMEYQDRVRMSIPLTLSPKGKQEFPLTIYRESNQECILTFTLLDDNQNILTTTQVGILPQCPKMRTSIDEGLDYTLPEIQEQTRTPESEVLPVKRSISSSTPSKETPQKETPLEQQNLIDYNDSELSSAVDLLIEKGILTEQDKEHLHKPLSRIAAAELFVKIGVINDLPREDTKTCEYGDISGLSKDQQNIALLACQYNIMGIHPDGTPLDNFMPNDIIPSEQLVTAFSRLMWSHLFESTEEVRYFEQHMNHMEELGIIDTKVLHSNQTLADFVVLAARSIEGQHLIISPSLPPEEKNSFRFW
jgi:hypothetical protein